MPAVKINLEKFEKILLEEKKEILQEIMDDNEDAKNILEDEVHNVNDSADIATVNISQNLLNILSSKNQKTLEAIDTALDRIKEGTYGSCVSCNEEIGEQRLEKLPWAPLCIKCKNKLEQKR